jgi:uncharacterized protein (TIGR03083 family)
MGGMEIAEHLDALDRDGELLADAAEDAGLTALVLPCPGWQVRDLVRHQAYVHGWAARHVRDRLPEVIDEATEEVVLDGGPPDAELIASYRAGHAALVSTLRGAAPDVACATFMPAPSPLAFWARRQAHETAIHRYDAQSAGSNGPPDPAKVFAPAFAADGIDEVIMGFAPRNRRLRGGTWSLAVRPTDDAGRWHVRPGPGKTEVARTDAAADCVLSGPASGLYVFLWNRCAAQDAGIEVTGDASVLTTWNSAVRVKWN